MLSYHASMFATLPAVPPPLPAAVVVIDERWTASAPAIQAPTAPAAKLAVTDPRITQGVAAMLAETPARDPAPNRQDGMLRASSGADTSVIMTRGFNEAKVPACLSPATGGLGILAIPVIAVQAIRGKCLMP